MKKILLITLTMSIVFCLNPDAVLQADPFSYGGNKVMPYCGATPPKIEGGSDYYWDGNELEEVDVLIPNRLLRPDAPSFYHTVVTEDKLTFHKTSPTLIKEDETLVLDLVTGNLTWYYCNKNTEQYFRVIQTITPHGTFTTKREDTGEVIEKGVNIEKYRDAITYMQQEIRFSYAAIDPDEGKAELLKPVVGYLGMVKEKLLPRYYWWDGRLLEELDVSIKPTVPNASPSTYHTIVAGNNLAFQKTGTAPQEDVTWTLDLVTGNLTCWQYRYDKNTKQYFRVIQTITPQGKITDKREDTGKIIGRGFNIERYMDGIVSMLHNIKFSYTAIDSDPVKAALLKPVVDYLEMVEQKLP